MLLQQAWVQFVYVDLGVEEILLGDVTPNIPSFILQLHFNTRVCQAWICPHFCFFIVKLHLERETTRNFQNNILNQIAVTAHKGIFPVHKKALRVCYCDFGSISTSSASTSDDAHSMCQQQQRDIPWHPGEHWWLVSGRLLVFTIKKHIKFQNIQRQFYVAQLTDELCIIKVEMKR